MCSLSEIFIRILPSVEKKSIQMEWKKKWKAPENRLGFVSYVCIHFYSMIFQVCISASVPFIGSDSRFCHVRQKPYICTHAHTTRGAYIHISIPCTLSCTCHLTHLAHTHTHAHILHCLFFFYIFSCCVYLYLTTTFFACCLPLKNLISNQSIFIALLFICHSFNVNFILMIFISYLCSLCLCHCVSVRLYCWVESCLYVKILGYTMSSLLLLCVHQTLITIKCACVVPICF